MNALLTRFAKDETGATSIEYGIIAAGIAVAIAATVQVVGGSVTGMFTTVATAMR
jgi:pilus assembly protein Flp/PilA